MANVLDLETWLREQCAEYRFEVGGVYQVDGTHSYPLVADSAEDLRAQLDAGGHLLPLPKESAALANVLEVSIVEFLQHRIKNLGDRAGENQGTERGYPDLEIFGEVFGGGFHAVDIKAARRAMSTKGHALNSTQSAITLYTGNTYFRHSNLKYPGTLRPFEEYKSHLDILLIYTLDLDSRERVRDLELIVQQPWKIASRQRSSTTREYIGAVKNIDALRSGNGAFETEEEFYKYWRAFKFNIAPITVKLLEKGAKAD